MFVCYRFPLALFVTVRCSDFPTISFYEMIRFLFRFVQRNVHLLQISHGTLIIVRVGPHPRVGPGPRVRLPSPESTTALELGTHPSIQRRVRQREC